MPPVLIAPLPWGVGSTLHRGLAAAFPRSVEVARVNAPGTFADAVASVELARRARGWERAVVVGHSMATVVALRWALEFPDQVAGVILVGGAAGPGGLRDGLWRPGHPKHPAWLAAYQELRATRQMRPYVERLLRLGLAKEKAWSRLKPDADAASMDLARMDAFFGQELRQADVEPDLPLLRGPALVVAGREDPLCTVRASEALAKGLPQAKLVVLEGCGHFPWVEQPGPFAEVLARFLGALPA